MNNFCIDMETGNAFTYQMTLESQYLQGRFGAVPNVGTSPRPQFNHYGVQIVEPKKLAKELRKLAEKLESGS